MTDLQVILNRIFVVLLLAGIISYFMGIDNRKFSGNNYVFSKEWSSEGKQAIIPSFSPESIAVASSGNLYVVDDRNNSIQKFDRSGKFIVKWGEEGDCPGEFKGLKNISADQAENIYVADTGNHTIQVFIPQISNDFIVAGDGEKSE
ncbi:MAG: 6-bladed beta-propeller [Candidatus Eremiobacterota bacterium]